MAVYSFSQIQVFQQCPRKYQYKYVEKIKDTEFESSPDLILGQSVHATLERLYKQINVFVVPTKDQVLADFHRIRDEEYAEATVEKELQIKWEQTIEDYIRRGEHYLEAYYDKHAPFGQAKIIGTETQLVFMINETLKQQFRGIIDRIDKEWDTFIINDYKTNKSLPPEQKQEYMDQLTLYGLAIQQHYGKYLKHIKARLHFLHFDVEDEREITQERLDAVRERYSSLIEQIEHKKFNYNMWDKKTFEPKGNPYCNYCEYASICPLRAHLKYEDEWVQELWEKTIKWLVDEYVRYWKAESEAKKQKEMIKPFLISYLEKHDLLKLIGQEFQLSASASQSISIKDKPTVIEYLKSQWILDEVLDIDRRKFEALIKKWEIDETPISDAIEKSPSWRLTPGKKK